MYAITHDGKAIGPDGLITDVEGTPLAAEDAEAYNQAVEKAELEHIKTSPKHIFAYVKKPSGVEPNRVSASVHTWRGVHLGWAWLGSRAYVGFGNSYRRAVTVRIFDTLYRGWYMESSGDYCKLTKAKKQDTKYVASIAL